MVAFVEIKFNSIDKEELIQGFDFKAILQIYIT